MTIKLAERLGRLMEYPSEELKERHLGHAPTELALDLMQLARYIDPATPTRRWQPADLPRALEFVPNAPLSLYGRGPNWLYAALALRVAPYPFYLFDPRLGWTSPVTLRPMPSPPSGLIAWRITQRPTHEWIEGLPQTSYLDYDDLKDSTVPLLDPQRGVVISGKLPHWLTVGIALAHRGHPWLAVVQAQQYDRGIVVMSRRTDRRPGDEVNV